MTFQVIRAQDPSNARSPFRIVQLPTGREVEWINRFLDREYVRRLAEATLRSYAMDLLHFLRWWAHVNHTDAIHEGALSATSLLDYLRFQAGQHPQPTAATINHRVGVVERALHSEFPDAGTTFAPGFHHLYWRRSPLGFSRPRPALSQLRVNEPKRIVMPLSVEEVSRFWSSFRTSRDLAIVGLMLLQGLRSKEVLTLNCEDVFLSESEMRVRGKGNKIRALPLASDTAQLLDHSIRFDPFDLGTAYAFIGGQWVQCHSDHYQIFQGRSQKELLVASKELRAQNQNRSPQYQITASKLAQAFQSINMQESLLVQRLRARESQALRQQTPHVDPSEGQVRDPTGEMNSVDFTELINTDAQIFDRF